MLVTAGGRGEVTMGTGTQRTIAVVVVVVSGVVTLPVVAGLLDQVIDENLLLPIHLVVMAAIGAVVGLLLPGIARAGSSRQGATFVGVMYGIGGAAAGLLLFFLLLNGIDGA